MAQFRWAAPPGDSEPKEAAGQSGRMLALRRSGSWATCEAGPRAEVVGMFLAACKCTVAWCVLAYAVSSAVPVQAQATSDAGAVLHLADQRLVDARLVDISETGDFAFQIGPQAQSVTRTIDRHQIVRWGRQRSTGGSTLVWLRDGSWLAGELHWKSEQAFELISDWFPPLDLPISQIRGLVLNASPSPRRFRELENEMLRVTGSADVLWNSNSEQLSGVLNLKLRQTVGEELPPSATWVLTTTAAAEAIELESGAVQAVVFSPILRRPFRATAGTVRVDMRDGSQLHVTTIGRTKDGRVALTLADNRVLEALDSTTQFASAVARITGEPEGISWLGALEPARYRFAEQAGELNWPLGRDEDLFGKTLSVGGEAVPHGIAMHAPSQVAYRWDGSPAKLLAEVSLYGASDGGMPGGQATSVGSAACKVLVARQGKLVEVFRSGVLRANSPAVPVDVDISDAQLVVLLVEQADQGPFGDHVLWREARLVPSSNAKTSKK